MALAPLLLAAAAVAAPTGAVTETIHGYRVEDPFRALETDEAAAPWIRAQNEVTARALAAVDPAPLRARLDELSRLGFAARAKVAGARTFFVRRAGDAEQPVLVVREADGAERVLVDPASADPGGKTALDWYFPSVDGSLVAYGLSKDGSEQSTLRIVRTADGSHLADVVPHTRAASIAWLPDGGGFYYTRYPAGERYGRAVHLHRLGADPGQDPLVFGEPHGVARADWPEVRLSPDGALLVVTVSKGWATTEVWTLDRATGRRTCLLPASLGALFLDAHVQGDQLLVRTDHGAPRFRIVAVDLDRPAPASWRTLVHEGDAPLDAFAVAGDRLAVVRLDRAVARLSLHDLSGAKLDEVPLPDLGTIGDLDGDPAGRLVLDHGSFLRPAAVLEISPRTGAATTLAEVPGLPEPYAFVVEQLAYPSYDGTHVPLFLVRRADAKPDGANLALLTGYGGFNVAYGPRFSPAVLHWVERGGIFAVANVRGGAELGASWHEAGRRAHKHRVFRDFEHAMRFLVREGWTRPARLAITGGSNGGLLVGAMMTQAPHLFRAAVGKVGLYDMIRYHRWPPAELWVDEYGSAADPDQVGYLLGYSPYHQAIDGVAYPAFLGLTARADTRVTWIHTAKFVARLQAAQGGPAPILFHLEEQAGHGQGKGRTDRVAEDVRTFQFLLSQLAPALPVRVEAR